MARKSFGHYAEFLTKILAFWTHVGPDFKVGEWDKAKLEAENADFDRLNEEIAEMEQKLGWKRGERDAKCRALENFDSRLRGALLGTFGEKSSLLKLVPRLMKAGPGRPNKSAETRKRNTLERKLAEKTARDAALRAEIAAELEAKRETPREM